MAWAVTSPADAADPYRGPLFDAHLHYNVEACDFRAACRRLHPPSRERVYAAKDGEVSRYLNLRTKSVRSPMLGGGDDAS